MNTAEHETVIKLDAQNLEGLVDFREVNSVQRVKSPMRPELTG